MLMTRSTSLPGSTVLDYRPGRREVRARVLTYHRADSFGSVWSPGVFSRSLQNKLPPILFAHDQSRPIGRTVSYDDGPAHLDVTARLADPEHVPDAATAISLIEDGIVTGWSVGFRSAKTSPVPTHRRSASTRPGST